MIVGRTGPWPTEWTQRHLGRHARVEQSGGYWRAAVADQTGPGRHRATEDRTGW